MIIKSFESGSSGNLHLIQDGNKSLMIEAGLSMKKIMNYMNLNVSGCLLSHYHADHSKSAKQLLKFGIDLYCTKETAEFLGLSGSRLKIIDADKPFNVDGFSCLSFRTNHDTPGAVGFLIDAGSSRTLFATDTGSLPYRFPGLTHVIIECNFSEDSITQENEFVMDRTRKTHMSLEKVLEFLKNNDLSRLNEIHLIHLSSQNSDKELFKRSVMSATGVPVYIS